MFNNVQSLVLHKRLTMGNRASSDDLGVNCEMVKSEDVQRVAGNGKESNPKYLALCSSSPILKKLGLIEEWKKDLDQPNISSELEDDCRIVCDKVAELGKTGAGRSHLLVNALAHKHQQQRM